MAIVKQGMLDWPGNDGEITSQRISRLSSSKMLEVEREVIFVNKH